MKKFFYILQGYFKLILSKITNKHPEYVNKRLQICNNCEYNNKGICKQCGCIIKAKVEVDFLLDKDGISIDGCPERKW